MPRCSRGRSTSTLGNEERRLGIPRDNIGRIFDPRVAAEGETETESGVTDLDRGNILSPLGKEEQTRTRTRDGRTEMPTE